MKVRVNTVIVEALVEWNGDGMAALTRKVDELVDGILSGALVEKVVDMTLLDEVGSCMV
jgi:hypothetical protein